LSKPPVDRRFKNVIATLPSCLPLVIALLGILGSGLLGYGVWVREKTLASERTELAARALQNELLSRMRTRIDSLQFIADLWRRKRKPDRVEFESMASFYGGPFSGYFLINWVDPAGEIRWAGPGLWGKKVVGQKVTSERLRREAWLESRKSRQIRITRMLDLWLGGRGFVVYVPAFDKDGFYGHVVGVFRVKELLSTFLPGELTSQDSHVIAVDGEDVYLSGSQMQKNATNPEVVLFFDIFGSRWSIRAQGKPLAFLGRFLVPAVFGFGVVLSILLGWLFHLFQTTVIQSIKLTELNESLEDRVTRRTAELAASRTKLEELNTELEQFASVASHDLREPLRGIGSYVRLLGKKYQGKLDADANVYIQYAIDGVNRMSTLIESLLTYARLGKEALSFKTIDCRSAIDEALSNLVVAIRDSGAEVIVGEMPCISGNHVGLVQLFQNLVGNAVKYRREEPPRIVISSTLSGSEWVFKVRDNGIGFSMEYKNRIFEAFRRLHGPKQYSGVGLGLAVCCKIVAQHGGRIWAESEEGSGSSFFFTIAAPTQNGEALPEIRMVPVKEHTPHLESA
jgi:signal transduction histidine kinase